MSNDAIKVHDLLGRLFEKPCTASEKKFSKQVYKSSVVFGRYVDDQDNLVAVVSADAAFTCYTGAAIMMMPAAVANDAKGETEFPEEITEAFGEVLNVLSRLFNTSDRPHCRYTTADYGKAPEDIKTFIKASSSRDSFGFDVGGYGEGTVTLFAA
ncbi:MAG: hypothetical protein KUG77_26060 [Nannocystaceae bacterium]|nr:hypothetical protein [Nannocystaceae bacterium]